MKRVIIMMILGIVATAYSANLPNMGSYSPLSKFIEKRQESQLVSARDPNRTRKASTFKKPWIGDSLHDMEEIVYPRPTPPYPPYPPYPPRKPFPDWDIPPYDPGDTEEDECDSSPCPKLCRKVERMALPTSPYAPPGGVIGGMIPGAAYRYYIVPPRHPCGAAQQQFPGLGWRIANVFIFGTGFVGYTRGETYFIVTLPSIAGGLECLVVTFQNTCTGALCGPIGYCDDVTPIATCTSGTITGCPTAAVAYNSTTGLSVSEGKGYTWSLSGGGSISATGVSATYTAPASNAGCANNGVVSLKCDGEVVDTCTIAVSGYEGCCWYSSGAYYYLGECVSDGTEFCAEGNYQCVLADVYDCDDNFRHTINICSGGVDCSNLVETCLEIHGGSTGPHDFRTGVEISNGCCPDALK